MDRYKVTITDTAYPITVSRVVYKDLDRATAKSIVRHLNQDAPECIWYDMEREEGCVC